MFGKTLTCRLCGPSTCALRGCRSLVGIGVAQFHQQQHQHQHKRPNYAWAISAAASLTAAALAGAWSARQKQPTHVTPGPVGSRSSLPSPSAPVFADVALSPETPAKVVPVPLSSDDPSSTLPCSPLAYLEEPSSLLDTAGSPNPALPTFTLAEVHEHNTVATRIWVAFRQGVYDVTEFLPSHPGGPKLLLAAGGSVEPFWHIYPQHLTPRVLALLEEMRIGNVIVENRDISADECVGDPFCNDPVRHPALCVRVAKPFNAETPRLLMTDAIVTPTQMHFVRNHLPVPVVDDVSA